jgi:2-phospho-L-lactate guanylyltransferase
MAALAIWLVVPAKPWAEAKSRLAAAVAEAERVALSRRWLAHLLATAQAVDALAGVAVISRDPVVRTLAAAQGAWPLDESGHDLNAALEQARAAIVAAGAEAVLVLPADLPLLTAADLTALCELAQAGDGVVIAPSHDGGTNALLLRPPFALPYAFGEDSFARHCALAAATRLPCRVYRSPTLAWDVDAPADLAVTGC